METGVPISSVSQMLKNSIQKNYLDYLTERNPKDQSTSDGLQFVTDNILNFTSDKVNYSGFMKENPLERLKKDCEMRSIS